MSIFPNIICFSFTYDQDAPINLSLQYVCVGLMFTHLLLSFLLTYAVSQPQPIEVQVITHPFQHYGVWFGGSMVASAVSCILSSLKLHTSKRNKLRVHIHCARKLNDVVCTHWCSGLYEKYDKCLINCPIMQHKPCSAEQCYRIKTEYVWPWFEVHMYT